MASRRDQLHSYQFMVQRVVSALVLRKTDPDQSPFRRGGGSLFAGAMIAILALAIAGAIGYFSRGGNTEWQSGKAIIVEKETTARYVYIDNVLHPVLNFTSGVLLTQGTEVIEVSRNSLKDATRGAPVGIPGLPDSLPGADDLLKGEWALCSRPPSAPGQTDIDSVLFVGEQPAQGHQLAAGEAVVAQLGTGESARFFMVTAEARFEIAEPAHMDVLGGSVADQSKKFAAEAAWLNSIPEGAALASPAIEGAGEPSAVEGVTIGQVIEDGGRFYVARATDVAEVTAVQAAMLRSDYGSGNGSIGQVTKATDLFPDTNNTNLPVLTAVPTVRSVSPTGSACATFHDDSTKPTVLVDASVPAEAGIKTSDMVEQGSTRNDIVDRVVIPAGHSALVETKPNNALGIVDETGRFFGFGSRDYLGYFGYTESDIIQLPQSLIAGLPIGPGLDAETAKTNAITGQ